MENQRTVASVLGPALALDLYTPAVAAWVTVTGTWVPEGELGSDEAWPPVLAVGTVVRIAQSKDPYEKP
ncbi:hypothetical protein [Streptomyces acidiscabies]|uniref:hypothetical protein n=1 Tax=Streptomyces acidiscabies TaxID=42234 RepID=UPI0038F7832B